MTATQRLLPVAASPRTHGLGHLAVVQARTGWRHLRPLTGVLLTLPATAVAAVGEDPLTHVKPCHGQVEGLLVLDSTGHCRPLAAAGGKPKLTFARFSELLSPATSKQHLDVIARWRAVSVLER